MARFRISFIVDEPRLLGYEDEMMRVKDLVEEFENSDGFSEVKCEEVRDGEDSGERDEDNTVSG